MEKGFGNAIKIGNNAAQQMGPNMDPVIFTVATWLFGLAIAFENAHRRLLGLASIPWTGQFTRDKSDISNPNNVIVYCNLNRLQEPEDEAKKAEGLLYDSDNGQYVSTKNGNYESCRTGKGPDGGRPSAAITNPHMSLDLSQHVVLTTMDLCPWWLEIVAVVSATPRS